VIICFRSRPGYEIEWSFLCRVVEQVKKGGCCERSRDGKNKTVLKERHGAGLDGVLYSIHCWLLGMGSYVWS
jgi:hypothetical protein